MALITVKQGGITLPDGVYQVALVSISGPKTITPMSGPNAGQDVEIMDWTWEIVDGEYKSTEITSTTSIASGPKSKMFSYLTALLGGKPPQVGSEFNESDLIGRGVLATVRQSESGWPRIETLSAMPASMMPGAKKAPISPVVPSAAATDDSLPF